MTYWPRSQTEAQIASLLLFFGFVFVLPSPQHMDVPGSGIQPEPQLRPNPQSWQHWILNPLSRQGTPLQLSFGGGCHSNVKAAETLRERRLRGNDRKVTATPSWALPPDYTDSAGHPNLFHGLDKGISRRVELKVSKPRKGTRSRRCPIISE